MPKRAPANPLALAVLSLLFERPMHPYEVAQLLRERHKHESIKLNYGSLYAVVDGLLERGLIAARETIREGKRPERTIYALTDAGRDELRGRMRELLGTPVKEFTQFEGGLALLPVLPPDEVAALLAARGERLEREIGDTRRAMDAALRQGVDRLFLVEMKYRLMLREAERRWVSALAASIEREPEFGRPWRDWHAAGATPGGLADALDAGGGQLTTAIPASPDDAITPSRRSGSRGVE